MSEKKIRFLFNTSDMFGTANAMISLAKLLKFRGHEIIFVSNDTFRQTIEKCGFTYEAKLESDSDSSPPQEVVEQHLMICGFLSSKSSLESIKIDIDCKLSVNVINQKNDRNTIKKCIDKYKPNIIVQYSLTSSAESVYSGLPWVGIYCESPINIYNNDLLPPFTSGYETNSDPNNWKEFKILKKEYDDNMRNEINKYYKEFGFPEIDTNFAISPYLNIYSYPKELDYSDIVDVPKNWFRVDSFFNFQTENDFVLPKQLENKNGKLIYVSMGTIGSTNLDLMKKLVSVLSKSSHRFIVSKGIHSAEYSLYDNMCGDSYLPQTAILPKVDLFITHGGNNSIAEAFFFGKPMIVMPLFYDQYDNAQRIHETGFGIRLNAQLFTENQLLSAIESLLNDTELSNKLKKVAQRIQSDNSLEKAVIMIENLKE